MASLHQVDTNVFTMPVTEMLDELCEALRANGDEETVEHVRKAYHATHGMEFTFDEREAIVRNFMVDSGMVLHLTGDERIALSRAVSLYLVHARERKAEHAVRGAERLFVKMEAIGLVGGGAAIACQRRPM